METKSMSERLEQYAEDTRADMSMGQDRATREQAIRAMRDEPSEVAGDVECTAAEVEAWCREQLA